MNGWCLVREMKRERLCRRGFLFLRRARMFLASRPKEKRFFSPLCKGDEQCRKVSLHTEGVTRVHVSSRMRGNGRKAAFFVEGGARLSLSRARAA